MYRGSRLAASFLLFLTGTAVAVLAVGILPGAIVPDGPWLAIPLVVAFAIAHFVALAGVARARAWGRDLAVLIAEAGGGIAIAALVAVALGADPFSSTSSSPAATANGVGILVWAVAIYLLLGLSAGRVQLAGWSRRSTWWPAPLLRIGAA
jgi:hypothetical protein